MQPKSITWDSTKLGTRLVPRLKGLELKEEALNLLEDEAIVLIVDLSSVEIMSSGYAKELFGGIWECLGSAFPERVRFTFGSNRQIMWSTIARGISASVERKCPSENSGFGVSAS